VLVLKLVTLDGNNNCVKLITLIDLNGHESFNFGTLKFAESLIQAHHGKLLHDSIIIFLFLVQVRDLVNFLALGESLLETGSPQELDTEQGDLGLIAINKFTEWHGEAVLSSRLTNLSNRLLHFFFKLVKPVFNLTFSLDTLIKIDILSCSLEVLVDGNNKTAVLLVEGN